MSVAAVVNFHHRSRLGFGLGRDIFLRCARVCLQEAFAPQRLCMKPPDSERISLTPSRKDAKTRKAVGHPFLYPRELVSLRLWYCLLCMPKKSAGLLLYRLVDDDPGIEVLLVHPGGPFWRHKDEGAWTIPKGEFDDSEDPLEAAKREFKEELGSAPPPDNYLPLRPIKQKNKKTVHAWAVKGDFDPASLNSNTFVIEWPPKSRRMQEFPEVDRAEWFAPKVARQKILAGQPALIDELLELLK